jgi:hypothetical protein
VAVTFIGYERGEVLEVYLTLAQTFRLDFALEPQAIELEAIEVTAVVDEIMNADRTGAATFLGPAEIIRLPSVKRSIRDLMRLDPRGDGNFSYGGRNWLYNNISLDGSYFNNSFGLDDPAVGGQTAAEPIPFDAMEQVQVSVAPFDVRQGGFTGANINIVTKSGTNQFKASAYSYLRNQSLVGNTVSGQQVIANPDLLFNQSGFTFSGPIARDKLFFFISGELERTDVPGTNFAATQSGTPAFGESRANVAMMDSIRSVMSRVYGYDTGPYQGFIHETDNDKLLVKLDWNINESNNLMFRYNFLDARRDLPPHPFVLSAFGSGRGPNESSLPFQNSGYQINNELHSFALELNSRSSKFANRFFASYNRFRDFRVPFSADFPTIEIAEAGVTYTTVGHEPFSIHNILDQDVWQFTNNFSLFAGKHVLTVGANFEAFGFYNSFNIFRHGVFFLPAPPVSIGTTFSSLNDFFTAADPSSPDFVDFNTYVGSGPFKGELIDVGQLAFYLQDEVPLTERFNVTLGARVDIPLYFTEPVDNPDSRALTALDENGNPETVDQSSLPGAKPLWSARFGFNWDVTGTRSTQVRGGTGIFTGRLPFVWVGNVISNPGANSNLWGPFNTTGQQIQTGENTILQQSFDLNAMVSDFKWPQVWTTNVAIDQRLPWDMTGTFEFIYDKDLNAIYMRNADLVAPVGTLPAPDGRPFYGGAGNNELNPDGGAGIYVIDNRSDGHSYSLTAQLRKRFDFGLNAIVGYTYSEAKSLLKSTEIASVLFQENPIQGDPNNPNLAPSEFGLRHRIVGGAHYRHRWSRNVTTMVGLFFEWAEGNRFAGQGGNRYSFTYSGDVNGDGVSANDLIYIPTDATDAGQILFDDPADAQAFEAFIQQDPYLSSHRGQIAERFGAVNPWFGNIDLRILQDLAIQAGGQRHTFQFSFDILNVANLLNSSWGVRKSASSAATSPLSLVRFEPSGAPVFDFTGPASTFIDDPGILSRWQIQFGLRWLFN